MDFTIGLSSYALTFPWQAILKEGSFGYPNSTTAVCASADGSKYYCSGAGLYGAIAGTRLPHSVMRLDPANTGGTGNNCIWGVGGPTRSCSAPITGAVTMGGGGIPHVQAYRDADGCSIWAHNHQNVNAVASSTTRVNTTGGRGDPSTDQSFVTPVHDCAGAGGTDCSGLCVYDTTNAVTTTETHDSGTGTFTTPSNGQIQVESWGGGGGGGCDTGGAQGQQGGGSGGYVITGPYPAIAGEIINYVVGVGGPGGTAIGTQDGTNGGDTTLTGQFAATAGGGKGGLGNPGTNTGAGGIASGDTTSTNGNAGAANIGTTGGAGGNAPAAGGIGGAGGTSGNAGGNATAPGAGGGGAGNFFVSGGAGANGRVKITFTAWDWVNVSNSCSSGCSCRTVDGNFYADFERPTASTDEINIPCG